jgi:RimJ/RimL family protein N-acetyltransferase
VSAPPTRQRVSASAVTLRPAEAADCQRVWNLRNEPETRGASIDSAPIPWDTHARWFTHSLERSDRRIFMVVVENLSQGVARLDIAGDEGAVSIHVAPEWRGRGVGPVALDKLVAVAFHELRLARLVATVKADNAASLSAFAKASFTETMGGDIVTLERRR